MPKRPSRASLLPALAIASLSLVACGSSEELGSTPNPNPMPTPTPSDAGGGDDAAVARDSGTADAETAGDLGAAEVGPGLDAGDAGGEVTPEPFALLGTRAPEPRVDLVFVGDGYTREEIGVGTSTETTYGRHVGHVANRIFTSRPRGATEPFFSYRTLFNRIRVNVESNESGIDEPLLDRDTALDGVETCEEGGRCYVDTAKVRAAVDAALVRTDIVPDVIVVVLNTAQPIEHSIINEHGRFAIYGGGPATGGIDEDTAARGIRQIGRALANLALNDPGSRGTYMGEEPDAPNLTRSSTGAKWAAWRNYDAPRDGLVAVNAFAGGGGYTDGVYRPVSSSKLAGDLAAPFDPVAREAIIHAIFERVPVIVGVSPDNAVIAEDPALLGITVADGSVVSSNVEWRVNGSVVTDIGTTVQFAFTPWARATGVMPGSYTVEARVAASTRFEFPRGCRPQRCFADFLRTQTESTRMTARWTVVLTP